MPKQGLVKLISEKERTLFTGETSSSFYEALITSDDTISQVVERLRPERTATVHASRALLLYRLVDVIAFSHPVRWTDSAVPRMPYPTLTIPVCFPCFSFFAALSTQSCTGLGLIL